MRGSIALQRTSCAIYIRAWFHFAPALECALPARLCAGVLAALLLDLLSYHDRMAATFAETFLIPERIKVEPIVRRDTRIMLQPRDVALHP